MKPYLFYFVICLSTGLVLGCKKSGAQRVDIAGKVVYGGTVIKTGFVLFTPDTLKGGKGPQGLAFIKDGKFDTRKEKGKGVSPGPQRVQINGFDGNITEEKEYGNPLFPSYTVHQSISQSNLELNFDVPKNSPQIPDNKLKR
jgi:hypothetical protein